MSNFSNPITSLISFLWSYINKFVEAMHQSFRLSYQANNKWSASRLLDKSQLPFLLDEYHIFMKYQASKGAPKRHGCYGYIALFAIADIQGHLIHLTDGRTIEALSTSKQLIKIFHNAVSLLKAYLVEKNLTSTLPLHTSTLDNRLLTSYKRSSLRSNLPHTPLNCCKKLLWNGS